MDKELAELVQKINDHDPDSEEAQDCVRCGDPYTLAEGTEPTALCHPCAQLTVAELVEAATKHPAHPAIPKEVRERLDRLVTSAARDLRRDGYVNAAKEWDQVIAWLAKCPQATDKAVCPKCGDTFGQRLARRSYESLELTTGDVLCPKCGTYFKIVVSRQITSLPFPPREPKVMP